MWWTDKLPNKQKGDLYTSDGQTEEWSVSLQSWHINISSNHFFAPYYLHSHSQFYCCIQRRGVVGENLLLCLYISWSEWHSNTETNKNNNIVMLNSHFKPPFWLLLRHRTRTVNTVKVYKDVKKKGRHNRQIILLNKTHTLFWKELHLHPKFTSCLSCLPFFFMCLQTIKLFTNFIMKTWTWKFIC